MNDSLKSLMADGPEPALGDLHQRLVAEFAARFANLPSPPPGQRWAFETELIDDGSFTITIRGTARLAPIVRVEGA